jgi:hypothetical protein
MYALTDEQIDHILNDIKTRGVEMEDLQLNLLDHICCIVECELPPDGNFDQFYQQLIPRFFKKELKEIEQETVLLLTFKNYYTMKKVMITTGVFSVSSFILGLLFKFMHWPGASVLLLLAIVVMSFVFLPLLFILKTKDSNSSRDKAVVGIGTFFGILLSISILFRIMHWPGAMPLSFASLAIFAFIFIPVYYFTGIRNPDTKLNTTVTTIILVGAAGLQFILINVYPPPRQTEIKMYTYLQSEDLLKKMQRNDTAKITTANQQLVLEINQTAEKIKKMILQDAREENPLEDSNVGHDFEQGNSGAQLFAHLTETIRRYNAAKNDADAIPLNHFQADRISSYSSYMLLDYLVQTQMYLTSTRDQLTAQK